jgi:ketosteroid isomerase-like protein
MFEIPIQAAGDALTASTVEAVTRFNDACEKHDVEALMDTMTDDCIFEDTAPFPDGTRYEGRESVRKYWARFFLNWHDAVFTTEEIVAFADRCLVRWVYKKTKNGIPWHIRGVDVIRVEHGKVAEKLSYVKG